MNEYVSGAGVSSLPWTNAAGQAGFGLTRAGLRKRRTPGVPGKRVQGGILEMGRPRDMEPHAPGSLPWVAQKVKQAI